MAIEDRNLEPGTKLIANYKKEEYRAEVVAGEEGKVRYRLADGRELKSPSAAGAAFTGKSCNGWAFWSVAVDGSPTELQEPESSEGKGEDSEGTDTQDQPFPVGFRRVPNQKGVGEGGVRLYGDACQTSFTAPVEATPETCPEGHTPDAGRQEMVEN